MIFFSDGIMLFTFPNVCAFDLIISDRFSQQDIADKQGSLPGDEKPGNQIFLTLGVSTQTAGGFSKNNIQIGGNRK